MGSKEDPIRSATTIDKLFDSPDKLEGVTYMAAASVHLPAISAFAYVKVGRIGLPVATA